MPGWWFCSTADGTGVSSEPELARLSAIGEAVERYCGMARSAPEGLVRAAFCDLRGRAVEPGSLGLLSDAQYRRFPRLAPFRERSEVDWCWAYSLTTGQARLVPAALVHFDRAAVPPNNFMPELGSSGLASHVSMPHAVLAGLCEVLERDALTIAWHNRLPLIPLEFVAGPVADMLDNALSDCGAEFSLFQVPTDAPFPVVLALAESDSAAPHAVVGAGCRPDVSQAAARALCEVSQMLRRQRDRRPEPPERVVTFEHHADFYSSRDGALLLRENLRQAREPRRVGHGAAAAIPDVRAEVAGAVSVLGNIGLEVLVLELTTADVAMAGYRVVRVIVPGTVDMSADVRFVRLGASRMYELPVRLGLRSNAQVEAELNLLPVPLA